MRAKEKTWKVQERIINRTGVEIPFDDAHELRLCEMTLHRWAEGECGDGDSTCIERDEADGKTYRAYYGGTKTRRYRIPDRETGALKRIASVCARWGLHFFHQTDPRGCALYVSKEPMTDSNYISLGVAVCE